MVKRKHERTPPRRRGTDGLRKIQLEVGEDTLAKALAFVAEASEELQPSARARLQTAADELLTNIVSYSGAKTLKIMIDITPGRTRLTLIDDGAAFNPLEHAAPDLTKPFAERPVGGLGILIVKKLFDDIRYRRVAGTNILTVRRIESETG